MRIPRRAHRIALSVAIVGMTVTAPVVAHAGRAPTPSPSPSPPARSLLTAKLVEFPSSLGPEGTLRIGLEVTNRGRLAASNLRVAVSIHEGIGSRSALERSFDGSLGPVAGSDTLAIDGVVGADETRTFAVEKPLSEISFFRTTPLDRAYPVRITLRADGMAASPLVTHMVFFAKPPAQRLGLSLVVPLHSIPMYSGREPALVSSPRLVDAVAGRGRLTTILSQLDQHPNTPITLAPTGVLLDMLGDLSDGFTRLTRGRKQEILADDPAAASARQALQLIVSLMDRPSNNVMASAYSMPFLPSLVRSDLEPRAQAQIDEGRARLPRATPGWLLSIRGALDERTLTLAQRSGISQIVLGSTGVRPASASQLTRGAPVQIRTRATRTAPLVALIEDAGLAERIGDDTSVSPVQARQRFLAETATIMLERPALDRAVVVVAPADWAPRAETLSGILSALVTSPWLSMTSPDAIVANAKRTGAAPMRTEDLPSFEAVQASGPSQPPQEYFAALRQGKDAIDRYADLRPPQERIGELERRLLIAESADWWASQAKAEEGTALARSIEPTVGSEFAKIRPPAEQVITLTSRNGVIPVNISSRLGYTVAVAVRLQSDKLTFPPPKDPDDATACQPQGQNEALCVIDQLQPRNQTLDVHTIAQATGTFPLRVIIETPSGKEIARARLTVRSTDFNVVAVTITGGAGVFLVAWWMAGFARKRLPA